MNEINYLDVEEDRYADETLCKQCSLPNTLRIYEVGFGLVQQQLAELRLDVLRLVERLDTLDHQ